MVLAHVRFAEAPWLQYVTMATVLFFASTGMNLVAIVEQPRQEARLASNALFLVFAGLGDNYVQGTLGESDVFQSAGLAMLAMLLLRRLWPRHWTWWFPLPFLVHFANQQLHWKIEAGGLSSFLLTPGLFPLLPWLSFYLLGAHLKRHTGRKPAWLIGGSALCVLATVSLFKPFQFDKFWMSPEYFLIGCAVAAISFAALRGLKAAGGAAAFSEIRRWGANSLVFYLANNFIIRVLELFMRHGVGLLLLSIAATALLLRLAIALQAWTERRRPATILLTGATVALALVAADRVLWTQVFYLHMLASFGIVLAFVTCYPAWKNLSRALAKPAPELTHASGTTALPLYRVAS